MVRTSACIKNCDITVKIVVGNIFVTMEKESMSVESAVARLSANTVAEGPDAAIAKALQSAHTESANGIVQNAGEHQYALTDARNIDVKSVKVPRKFLKRERRRRAVLVVVLALAAATPISVQPLVLRNQSETGATSTDISYYHHG